MFALIFLLADCVLFGYNISKSTVCEGQRYDNGQAEKQN